MKKILGIGGVCIDRLLVIPRMPTWDEVEHVSRSMLQQGGMVGTAMVAASRLGEDVEFIGGIGDDEAGRFALEGFRDEEVGTERVKVFIDEETASSTVLVHEESGKRTILHARGVQEKPSLELSDINLTNVGFLHVDGYWFDTALKFAKAARRQGIPVSLDPSSKLLNEAEAEALLPFVDYMVPNAAFAHRFTGREEPFEAAKQFLKYGARAVLMTQGKEGCVAATSNGRFHVPAFEVPVVDTTGAGDTFHGAFAAGLNKGYALVQAIQFASAAAALQCTKLGGQSGIPTLKETLDFLNERGMTL